MNTPIFRIFLLNTFIFAATASSGASSYGETKFAQDFMTVECTLTDVVTDPKGQMTSTVTTQIVSKADPFKEMDAGSFRGIRSLATINLNNDESLEVFLGDFCGERYLVTTFPSVGTGITDRFSYGQDGEGYWKSLTMTCVEK